MRRREWTRRQAIGRSGALLAGAAAAAGVTGAAGVTPLVAPTAPLRPRTGPTPAGHAPAAHAATSWRAAVTPADTPLYQSFVSRPDLQPPVITMTESIRPALSQSGYLFVAPHGSPIQLSSMPRGQMIIDWTGELVWFNPASHPITSGTLNLIDGASDFQVQTYRGNPVLTWYGLVVQADGTPAQAFTIADRTYTPIATVAAAGDSDYTADGHDIVLTSRGTAYITTSARATADLTPLGGPASAPVTDSVVQEIDIATGELIFQWSGLANIPVADTYQTYSSTAASTDLYHFNSVSLAPDGNLLISCRHTWTVYKVSAKTGAIIWRLGGKRSGFTMGTGAGFAWQHDVNPHGPDMLTIFDNEAQSQTVTQATQSRALILRLNTDTMHATVNRSYTRPGGVLATAQGSVQPQPDGRVLVGWGAQPYLTEFSPDGQVLLDGQYPVIGGTPQEVFQSYRALRYPWSARPAEPPAAAVLAAGDGTGTVYASWNGATDVARWTVLAGPRPASLTSAGTAARTGFETAVPTTSAGPYFVAVARDARGRELARSEPVALPALS